MAKGMFADVINVPNQLSSSEGILPWVGPAQSSELLKGQRWRTSERGAAAGPIVVSG